MLAVIANHGCDKVNTPWPSAWFSNDGSPAWSYAQLCQPAWYGDRILQCSAYQPDHITPGSIHAYVDKNLIQKFGKEDFKELSISLLTLWNPSLMSYRGLPHGYRTGFPPHHWPRVRLYTEIWWKLCLYVLYFQGWWCGRPSMERTA